MTTPVEAQATDRKRSETVEEQQSLLTNASPALTGAQASLVELQNTAGNQAVLSLLSGSMPVQRAPMGGPGLDVSARVERLRQAIELSVTLRRIDIDLEAAAQALAGMTREEGFAVKTKFEQDYKWNLRDLIYGELNGKKLLSNLGPKNQTRLGALLGGEVAQQADPRAAMAQVKAVGSMLGLGDEVASAAGAAAFISVRDQNIAREKEAAARRNTAKAIEINHLINLGYRDRVLTMLRPLATREARDERAALDEAYQRHFGDTLYMSLLKRFKGPDWIAISAIWGEEPARADAVVTERKLEKLREAEAQTKATTKGFIGKASASVAQKRERAARAAVREHLEGLAEQPAESGDGGKNKLEAALEESSYGTEVRQSLKARKDMLVDDLLAKGKRPEFLGSKWARSEREGTLKATDLENAMLELRAAAKTDADREAAAPPTKVLGEVGAAPPPAEKPPPTPDLLAGAYLARFEARFDAESPRPLAVVLASKGSLDERERNAALYVNAGDIPDWQKMYYAIRSEKKDLVRVRRILGDKPKSKIDELARQYHENAPPLNGKKRDMITDLLGSIEHQQSIRHPTFDDNIKGRLPSDLGRARTEHEEMKNLLRGGVFEPDPPSAREREEEELQAPQRDDRGLSGPKMVDEASILRAAQGRTVRELREEAKFVFDRISQKGVSTEYNRKTYALGRDFLGNVDYDILKRTGYDAAATLRAVEEAAMKTPPDLDAAAKGVGQLYLIDARMTHNVSVYHERTEASFNAFLDAAVFIATTIATAGQGGAILMAIRATAATVATKVTLKGGDYSADEFWGDVRGGVFNVMGGKVSKELVGGLSTAIAVRYAQRAERLGLSKSWRTWVTTNAGAAAKWEAENLVSGVSAGLMEATATGNEEAIYTPMSLGSHGEELGQDVARKFIRGVRGPRPRGRKAPAEPTPSDARPPKAVEPAAPPARPAARSDDESSAPPPRSADEPSAPAASEPSVRPARSIAEPSVRPARDPAAGGDAGAAGHPVQQESVRSGRDPRGDVAGEFDQYVPKTTKTAAELGMAADSSDWGRANRAEQQRRASANPDDLQALRASTRPDERARVKAAEFEPLFDDWDGLKTAEARRARMQELVNSQLARDGAHPVKVVIGEKMPPGHAEFDPASWTITLSKESLSQPRPGIGEFSELVAVSLHEARHSLHYYRAIRVASARGSFDPTATIDGKALAAALDANLRRAPEDDLSKEAHDEALEIYDLMYNQQRRRQKHGAGAVDRAEIYKQMDAAEAAEDAAQKAHTDAADALGQIEKDGRAGTQEHRDALRRVDEAHADWVRTYEVARAARNKYRALPEESDAYRIQFATEAAMAERLMMRSRLNDVLRAKTTAAAEQRAAVKRNDTEGAEAAAQRYRQASFEANRIKRELDDLALGGPRRAETMAQPDDQAAPDTSTARRPANVNVIRRSRSAGTSEKRGPADAATVAPRPTNVNVVRRSRSDSNTNAGPTPVPERDRLPAPPPATPRSAADTPPSGNAPRPRTAAASAGPGRPAGQPGPPSDAEIDAAFASAEGNLYRVPLGGVRDMRFSREQGSELDVGGVKGVTVQEGPIPLEPGAPAMTSRRVGAPPETWLLDPTRANLTDPDEIANEQFRPNRVGSAYDVRNAQIVAGPGGDKLATPSGPNFGENRVVGGARGSTLDTSSGTWQPGSVPYERPYNPLGQDAAFAPTTAADWHAWEQAQGKLTDEQRYALWFYSDDLSGHINPALRGGRAGQFVTDPVALAGAASDLDQTMRPVPFDTVVHRKASVADFAALGVNDPAELTKMIGKSYAQEGYTSTAIESGQWSGEVEIVIEVPKGTRGRYLGPGAPGGDQTNPLKPAPSSPKASMPSEMEFLIERGTSFTIQRAEYDQAAQRWRVQVRVAEQGVKAQPLSNPVPLPGVPPSRPRPTPPQQPTSATPDQPIGGTGTSTKPGPGGATAGMGGPSPLPPARSRPVAQAPLGRALGADGSDPRPSRPDPGRPVEATPTEIGMGAVGPGKGPGSASPSPNVSAPTATTAPMPALSDPSAAPTMPQPVARTTQRGYPPPRPPAAPGPAAPAGPVSGGGGGASKIVAETADVVAIDRTRPMSASGFAGATAQRSRYGAFEARVRLPSGDEVDVVVKIIPTKRQGKDAGGFFAKEVEGARAAAQTGLGPDFYGVVPIDDGYGFAMAKVPGAFVENFAKPGDPDYVRAEAETQAARNALTDRTPDDVRAFGKKLLDQGYYLDGEVQGMVGPDGRWRPIDFAGVKKLPAQGPNREEAITAHTSMIESEARHLQTELATVKAERGNAGPSATQPAAASGSTTTRDVAAPDDVTTQMPAASPDPAAKSGPGATTRPMKTAGQPKATSIIRQQDVPALSDPSAAPTTPQPVARTTQQGYPAPRPPAAPTPAPGSGGGSGAGDGGSGGGGGQPGPSYGDAYRDPVAASQLAADHILLGGPTRLLGRGEGRRVWQQEYGGAGDRAPAAWYEPGGKLVLDSDQIPMPVRSADILQGPVRQGVTPPPAPEPGSAAGPDTRPTTPGMPAPGGPRGPATRTGTTTSPGMPAPGGPKTPGPTEVQAAEAELGLAVMARDAAETRLAQARAATRQAESEADRMLRSTAEAEQAVDVATARLAEARAIRKVREARLAAATGASEPDRARLAREAQEAISDEGYAEVRLGDAQKQAVRAKREAEGIATSRAREAARAERRNVQPINDPDEAARQFIEGQSSNRRGLPMARGAYVREWQDIHGPGAPPPLPEGGWRRADGTVVIDASNPRIRAEVERLALARKAASGGRGGPGGAPPRASDSGAIPVPIDDPNEAVPEPIEPEYSRRPVAPGRTTPEAVPEYIEPERTGPVSVPKPAPDPNQAVPEPVEPEYARPPVKARQTAAPTVAGIPSPDTPAPDYEELEVTEGGRLGKTTTTTTGNRKRTRARRASATPLGALNTTNPSIAGFASEDTTETVVGKTEEGADIKKTTSSRTNVNLGLKGMEAGKEISHTTAGGTKVGAGANVSADWSGNVSMVGSATFQSRSGLSITPTVGHSDQADASDPQYIEGVGFLVTFKISSTGSVGLGAGKSRRGRGASVNVGKSETDYQSGSRILKTYAEAIDFRDNVRQRAQRSAFMPPPTSVMGALQIPMGESRGGGTATATTIGGSASYAGGLGGIGYTHASTSNQEVSVMRVGPTTVDVTRTFSEDTTSDPNISGLGLSNTKGTGGETGRAVTYRFNLATESGAAAFNRWCANPQPPGAGATDRRVKTFKSANAHDDYGFPVKYSASWKGRVWESREVDEAGNVTETFGGAQDRDIRTGWISENITRDKEQHANAQIEATLKNGKESYAARFTVSGKSGDSNLEELGKMFSGARHDAGDSSGYWLVTAQIDPVVVRDLERNSKAFRNAKTTADRMRIYTDYAREHGAHMISGQVRSGGDPLAWNLELPGDPNFPGASGRAELEGKHKAQREQLAEKHDSAAAVADDAKQTIAKLEKRKAQVADRKRYTDLPDQLREQQVKLIDQHLGKFAAVRSQSESLAMRNDPNEDIGKIRARATSPGGYDKLPDDQREIRKLSDAVAMKEQDIATASKRVEAANAILKRMMPNNVRRDPGVKFSVYWSYNLEAKQHRDIAMVVEPKLKASAQKARDLRNQWSDAKDDPSRLVALRALDAELKDQLSMVELELQEIREATRSAYIVTSDVGIGKDWDYFKAINVDDAQRSLAINTAAGDVPEEEL